MPTVVHRNWQSPFLAPPPVYLDSSITVAWLTTADKFHQRATQFVGDHLVATHELQVSLLTLDETIWRLIRGLLAQKQPGVRNPAAILKAQPRLLGSFQAPMKLAVGYVLGWASLTGASIVTPQQVVSSWLDRFVDIGAPHDAMHLSIAEHSGAKSIATCDSDFRAVRTLPVPMQILRV